MKLHPCECEHISHFEKGELTPNGNPNHDYGNKYDEKTMVKIRHDNGTELVCADCANDCRQDCERIVEFNAFIYPNGKFVSMDRASGGYPYETDDITQIHKWPHLNSMARYSKSFPNLEPRKFILTISSQPLELKK